MNGKAVVFLERQPASVMAGAGDIVYGQYRVEAVERDRALLRYLPLDAVQMMAFGSGGGAEPRAPATPQPRGPLFVNIPDEVPYGQERPVMLGIAPGSAAARATVEFTYDAQALAVTGAKVVRPGKALVEVNAQASPPSKPVHLKALGEETIQTEIGVEVTAFDAQGRSIEVRGIPAQHIISLGSAS